MSDFLNSAWNYINAAPGSTDKLVGQTVELGPDYRLRIKKIIAEGTVNKLRTFYFLINSVLCD